jgi:hypothetical protein
MHGHYRLCSLFRLNNRGRINFRYPSGPGNR